MVRACRASWPFALPVDPCDRDVERNGRDHVVEVALRGMEPAAAADAVTRCGEVAGRWLVRPDLFRGHDDLEGHREVLPRAGQQIVVHVGQDPEGIAGLAQALEGWVGIRERLLPWKALRQETSAFSSD